MFFYVINLEVYYISFIQEKDMHTEEYNGHQIEIEEGKELFIDKEEIPFVKTDEGYLIYYQPPEKTLLDAAKSYLNTQSRS